MPPLVKCIQTAAPHSLKHSSATVSALFKQTPLEYLSFCMTSETGRQLSAQTVIATAAQPCGKGDTLPLPLRIDTETNSVLRVRKQRGGLSGLEETTLDEDRTRCWGRAAVVALNLGDFALILSREEVRASSRRRILPARRQPAGSSACSC